MQAVARLIVAVYCFAQIPCVYAEAENAAQEIALFSTQAMPPECEKDFNRGLEAAGAGDWGLAVAYFSSVQRKAPYYAPVLFNLGLAHANAGNDAAAIAWFHAYLHASPDAGNAAAVRQQIVACKQALAERADGIFSRTEQAAGELTVAQEQNNARSAIAAAKAEAGYKENASDILYAKTLARLGDFKAAVERLEASGEEEKDDLWLFVGDLMAARKDLSGAWKAYRRADGSYSFAGKAAGIVSIKLAEDDLVFAEEAARSYPQASTFQRLIALKKAALKDVAGVESAVEAIADAGDAAATCVESAIELLRQNDPVSAEKIARHVLDYAEGLQAYEKHYVGIAYAVLGDYQKAFSAVASAELNSFYPVNRSSAYADIAYIAILKGNEKMAQRSLDASVREREGVYRKGYVQWRICGAYSFLKQIDKALLTVKKMGEKDSEWLRVNASIDIANACIKEGDFEKARATLGLYGFSTQASGQEQTAVRKSIAADLLAKGDVLGAYDLFGGPIEALEKEMKGYKSVWNVRCLEELLNEQGSIAVTAGIGEELAGWAAIGRLLSSAADLTQDLENAKKPYENAPGDYIIACTARVAQHMLIALKKLEQMERGAYEGSFDFILADL